MMSRGMTYSQWKKLWGVNPPRRQSQVEAVRQAEKKSASNRLTWWIIGILFMSGIIGGALGLNPAGILIGMIIGIVLHRFWLYK
jgi:hypothetical protein